MRYLIAVLAITCLASTSDAGCRGKRIRKATAAVVKAPVQAVRTIVCNGKTCVAK